MNDSTRSNAYVPAAKGNGGWVTADWFHRAHRCLMADFGEDVELKREMVQFLFDAGFYDATRLTFASGMQRFNDCLLPAKPVKFRITEIWALSVQFRRFATIGAMWEDLSGEPIRVIELLEQIAAAQREQNELLARILDGTGYAVPTDGRMHPHLREGAPQFSVNDSDTGEMSS